MKLEKIYHKFIKEDWQRLYDGYHTLRKVGKELNITGETVRVYLSKFNIDMSKNRCDKYYCNEDFFDLKYASENSFYWAGFIAADGCVMIRKKYKYLKIGLAIKDLKHLEKFVKDIKFAGPITKRKSRDGKTESCSMYVSSNKIFDDLNKFNIVPRKTHIYYMPDWLLKHKYLNHFIRGYFDGDGSFYISYGKRSNTLICNFRGTEKMLNQIKNIFIQSGTTEKIPRLSCGIYSLSYGKQIDLLNIYKYFYTNVNIFLYRKQLLALQHLVTLFPEENVLRQST